MAILALNDVFLVTAVGSIHNQRTMTTFHYRIQNRPAGATVEDGYTKCLDLLQATGGMEADYRGCCPSNWTFDQWWVQKIIPTRIVKKTRTVILSGLDANASTLTNVAAVITRRDENAFRSGIGSAHIPISPASCLNGGLTAALQTKLETLASEMLNHLLDVPGQWDFEPSLYHRPLQPAQPFVTPIKTVTAQTTSRVVRRRTVGLGV